MPHVYMHIVDYICYNNNIIIIDNLGLSKAKLISVVVSGATIALILALLSSFIITSVLCTRKSRNSKRDNLQQVQAVNPIEVVYDEIQCYQSVGAPKDQDDGVILKDNPAYGELAM